MKKRKSTYRPIADDEMSVFDGMLSLIDALPEERKKDLLMTFMMLLGCVDPESGRIIPDHLTQLLTKLSDGNFRFP